MNQRGVALLAVIWVIALLGATSSTGMAKSQQTVWAATNRVTAIRARWAAQACLALARAALDVAARDTDTQEVAARALSQRLESVPLGDGLACGAVTTAHPGFPTNINTAGDSLLLQLPGFDGDAVEAIRRVVSQARQVQDFSHLLSLVSESGRQRLLAKADTLASLLAYRTTRLRVEGIGIVHQTAHPAVREDWVIAQHRIAVTGRMVR